MRSNKQQQQVDSKVMVNQDEGEVKRRNVAKIGKSSGTGGGQQAQSSTQAHQKGDPFHSAINAAIQKQNYNSQPNPIRPSAAILKKESQGTAISESQKDISVDPSKILKQMSQQQIVQLLRDPEISRILKESMLQQEQEDVSSNNDHHMPNFKKHRDPHEAHQVDVNDPTILGNEFEVPQEQTLNTEDFQFNDGGVLGGQPKTQPKLYVGLPQGFLKNDDSEEETDLVQGLSDQELRMIQDILQQNKNHADQQDEEDQQMQHQLQQEQYYSIPSEVGDGFINLDNLQEVSGSSSEIEDCDLAFQLFDGEEMNAGMANFIGIHRMQSLNSPMTLSNGDGGHERAGASDNQGVDPLDFQMPFSVNSDELVQIFGSGNDGEEQEQYMCPHTGAHFHKADLYQRILKLKKRRALIDRAIAEEYKMQKRANAKHKQISRQIIQAQPQVTAKVGRNKNSQLGHGRQILTDGNERSHSRRIRDMSNNASSTNNNGRMNQDSHTAANIKLLEEEDTQAVVMNAGRAKYVSNSSRQAPPVKVQQAQQSNQFSQNSFAVNNHSSKHNNNAQNSKNPPQHQTKNQQHSVRSQGRTGGVQIQHIKTQQTQQQQNQNYSIGHVQKNGQQNHNHQHQQNQPPHERLLQFAPQQIQDEQFMTNSQSVGQSRKAATSMGQSNKQKTTSSVVRRSSDKKHHIQATGENLTIPSAYHSHDSRRHHQQQQQQQQASQAMALTQIQKSSLPVQTGENFQKKRNTVANAYNSRGSNDLKNANQGKQIQLVSAQKQPREASYHKKGESVSFDQRHIVQHNDPENQRQQSIEATEAHQAYRSMQDQRSMQVVQPQISIHQYRTNQSSNQVPPPSQLVGVKSSQIDSGSRFVSKISIQKAKLRQKQMVSAVLQNSKQVQQSSNQAFQHQDSQMTQSHDTNPSKHHNKSTSNGNSANRRGCAGTNKQQSSTFESRNAGSIVMNSASGASYAKHQHTAGGYTQTGRKTNDILVESQIGRNKNSVNSEAAQKLGHNANMIMKKLQGSGSSKVQKVAKNSQQQQQLIQQVIPSSVIPTTNQNMNASQIEQVEQFYQMLSGQNVVFNRPSNVTSTRGGKDKTKPVNQGTHARTNTFDNRVAQSSVSSKIVAPSQQMQQQVFLQQSNKTTTTVKSTNQTQATVKQHSRTASGQQARSTNMQSVMQPQSNSIVAAQQLHHQNQISGKATVSNRYFYHQRAKSKQSNSNINAVVSSGMQQQSTMSDSNDPNAALIQRPTTTAAMSKQTAFNTAGKVISRPKSKSIQSAGRNHSKSTRGTAISQTNNVIPSSAKQQQYVVVSTKSDAASTNQKGLMINQLNRQSHANPRNQNVLIDLQKSQQQKVISPQANSQVHMQQQNNNFMMHGAANQTQQPLLVSQAAMNQKAIAKSYNSVPLKQSANQNNTGAGQQQQNNYSNYQQQMLYRMETDQASGQISRDSSIQGVDFLQRDSIDDLQTKQQHQNVKGGSFKQQNQQSNVVSEYGKSTFLQKQQISNNQNGVRPAAVKSQHRRNASMYYPSSTAAAKDSLTQAQQPNSDNNVKNSGGGAPPNNSKHKKSNSMNQSNQHQMILQQQALMQAQVTHTGKPQQNNNNNIVVSSSSRHGFNQQRTSTSQSFAGPGAVSKSNR